MIDSSISGEILLEVHAPDGSRHDVSLTELPFHIGRGEPGNHLAISDDRISRQCAAITSQRGHHYLEDRGNRRGVFVNQFKIARHALRDGDLISFGLEDSHKLIFRCPETDSASIHDWIARMEHVSEADASSGGLSKLNLLLEATTLLHSQLPLDAVLEAMLDRAIEITNADRGVLLESDGSGPLHNRLERRAEGLAAEGSPPSQTALSMALKQESAVITEDLHHAEGQLQGARSIVDQRLRAVIAVPLYSMPRARSNEPAEHMERGQLLGVLYLDSQRPAAFSKLDRQILDAIAIESASILDNARLVQREQERQRVEQELNIARDIQQALLPRGFRDFPHLTIRGANVPCQAVGGDYFDICPIDDHRTAFLIADVSGKGLGAALLTTMLQGVFSGMTAGTDPVRVFRQINDFLCDRSAVGRHATLFFGDLDRDGNLEYLNAGHPSPLLVRHGKVTELFTGGSLPLGLVPEAQYTSARTMLEPGDTLVLFSDGVTEAENREGELFGDIRLQSILAKYHDAPLDRLQQAVFDSVKLFSAGASQADDITLLLVRCRVPVQTAPDALTIL